MQDFSVEALSEEMIQLQDSPELLKVYSKNALEGRSRFDRKHFVENQLSIFERLVTKPV
jgi:hypothetical protein